MSTLEAAAQQVLEAWDGGEVKWFANCYQVMDTLRAALEQLEPRNQCGETCERAKLCATCARGLEQDVPETDCGDMQAEWADIPREFNDWWDADRLTQTNPFREDSAAYWAWEGWQARDALEQPEQEPVAWMYEINGMPRITFTDQREVEKEHPEFKPSKPLYTAPHRSEWRGLTEEELRDALRECPHDTVENLRVRWLYAKDFARAIEAALKEKNT